MKFDIIFLDQTAPKPYDRTTLEKQGLGGTEASVIRVAEGLGSLGLSVAVIQTTGEPFDAIYGQNCFYLHANNLPQNITCDHFIQLRGISATGLFPKAKQYTWLHDLSNPNMKTWFTTLRKNKITVIGVSRWHRDQIKKDTEYDKVEYIYNPVPDEIYIERGFKPVYDKNTLVWVSSPHKGLGQALLMFQELKKQNSLMNFIVFNPGYVQLNKEALVTMPGVQYYGPSACKSIWPIIQRSLCIFYPGTTEETFCCVAAEANAVGTPIATYRKGALSEVVSSNNQLVDDGNESELIKLVLDWSNNGRPSTRGRDEYRFTHVIKKWVELLDV